MRDTFPILLIVLAGCTNHGGPPAASAPAPAEPPKVSLVSPKRMAIQRVVEQPGTVQAYEEAQLVAKLPGYVAALHADIGQRVKAGDLLAEVSIPETVEEAKEKQSLVRLAEAQVEQARKALAAAEAAVTAAEAAHTEAKAGLGRAQALHDRWESEARRLSGLVQGGVIDAQTRDETQNQFRAASATRDEARARVATAEAGIRKAAADRDKMAADVTAAQAKLEVARAEARRYEALLSYTKVRAPFDGVVTRRHVNTGDFLQASGRTAGVFTVAQLNPVRIVVDVPEMDAPLIREKGPIKLIIQSLGRDELSATVTRTSWSLEPSSRTLRVEVDQPNPEGLLRPGMYAYAQISVPLPETWALPVSAVVKQGETHVCFRVEGGKAVRTPVQVGRSDGQHIQLLRLQKPGSSEWAQPDGSEAVAQQAASLTDGQAVQLP